MNTATFGVVAVVMFGALTGAAWQENKPEPREPAEQQAEKSEDPVCHLMVRHDPELSVEYEGHTYYFCMKRDLEAFEKNPRKYLEGNQHDHPDPVALPPAG